MCPIFISQSFSPILNDYYTLIVAFLMKQIQNRYRNRRVATPPTGTARMPPPYALIPPSEPLYRNIHPLKNKMFELQIQYNALSEPFTHNTHHPRLKVIKITKTTQRRRNLLSFVRYNTIRYSQQCNLGHMVKFCPCNLSIQIYGKILFSECTDAQGP